MDRKANWAEASIDYLVDLVTDPERWAIIRGRFGPSLTIQTKQRVWNDITERVNASSASCNRSVKDIKKKWQDIQSHTKKKEANRKFELRKTGGGPPPPELKCWEKKIVSILSEDVISGVEGGFDSCGTASLPTDKASNTQSGGDVPVPKRRCEEADFQPEMGMEAPLSSDGSKPVSGRLPTTCSSQSVTQTSTYSYSSSKKRQKNDAKLNDDVKDRLLEIEEKKLNIMEKHLEIEQRKLQILEDYINWRKEESTTPTVSPVIKGLFTS